MPLPVQTIHYDLLRSTTSIAKPSTTSITKQSPLLASLPTTKKEAMKTFTTALISLSILFSTVYSQGNDHKQKIIGKCLKASNECSMTYYVGPGYPGFPLKKPCEVVCPPSHECPRFRPAEKEKLILWCFLSRIEISMQERRG